MMRKKMVSFLVCLMIIFCQSTAFGSSEGSVAALIEGAKREGKLVIYESMLVPDINELQKKFTEKYPFIKTELFHSSSRGLLTRFMAETKSGRYTADIIGTAGPETYFLKKEGLLLEYAISEGPFFQVGFKDPYWVAVFIFPHVIGYNTKLVVSKDVPKSYNDLLNKKWEGKLAMDRDDYEWFSNQLDIMGEGKGTKFMEELSKQKIAFHRGRRQMGLLLAAGEVSMAVNIYAHVLEDIKRQGAAVNWVPIDPVLASIHTMEISSRSPHPNAAKLFLEFVSSKEGQQIISNQGRVPARSDVKLRYPNLIQGIRFVPVKLELAERYNYYTKEFGRIFKR